MRVRLLAAGALAVTLVAARGGAQDPAGDDPSEVLNALLGGLLGFKDLTGPELQNEVAEAGGIPFKADVPVDFMSRTELAKYLREVFDAEYPVARARADERLLTAFGLLEPGLDLRALRARVLEENIAGFYDDRPGHRKLFAVSSDRRMSPANQIILAHELRHALQDQHLDLRAQLPDSISDFDDRRLAWVSLLEGDATLVMERFLLRRLPGAAGAAGLLGASMPTPDVPGAPPVVRDQLVRPYFVGRDLVSAIVARSGWEGVAAAWREPPQSTEQVLHLEKFVLREPPRPVDVASSPAGGRLVAEGVLGELLIQTLVDGAVAPAEGWGGDRYAVWDVAGRTLLIWRSVWDSETDAREFRIALQERLRASRGACRETAGFEVHEAAGGWTRGFREIRGVT
ncbi:MAG TPA: hypothetical protein VI669_12370, partial [Vicinamibacteria bacterium]